MTRYNPELLPKVRSRTLLDAVQGMPCTLRLASFVGMQCAHADTVVPCHLPTIGKGIATKVSDLYVAAGCMTCHSILDMRDPAGIVIRKNYPHAYAERIMRAGHETQAMLVEKGVIIVMGGEIVA